MVPKAWRKRRFKCVDMTSLSTLNVMTPLFLYTAYSDFLTSNQLYTAYHSFDCTPPAPAQPGKRPEKFPRNRAMLRMVMVRRRHASETHFLRMTMAVNLKKVLVL